MNPLHRLLTPLLLAAAVLALGACARSASHDHAGHDHDKPAGHAHADRPSHAGESGHDDHAGHGHGHGHGEENEFPAAANYEEGEGLELSAPARAFLGLQTAPVAARALPGQPTAETAPAIPAAAVVRTVRGDFVFVASDHAFRRTAVALGAAADGWHAVQSGLKPGEIVVTHGAMALWLAELQAINGGSHQH